MAIRWVAAAAVAFSVLTCGACGGTTSSASSGTSTSTAPMTSSPARPGSLAGLPPLPGTAYTPPTSCLMTVADVSSVLGGTWSRSEAGGGSCVYRSDRGAMFAITPIKAPPSDEQASLADARIHNCATPPQDVPDTGGGFVCIERPSDGDVVEGNIIGQGYFWLIVMNGQGSDRSYPAQTHAMAALLSAVRP